MMKICRHVARPTA